MGLIFAVIGATGGVLAIVLYGASSVEARDGNRPLHQFHLWLLRISRVARRKLVRYLVRAFVVLQVAAGVHTLGMSLGPTEDHFAADYVLSGPPAANAATGIGLLIMGLSLGSLTRHVWTTSMTHSTTGLWPVWSGLVGGLLMAAGRYLDRPSYAIFLFAQSTLIAVLFIRLTLDEHTQPDDAAHQAAEHGIFLPEEEVGRDSDGEEQP